MLCQLLHLLPQFGLHLLDLFRFLSSCSHACIFLSHDLLVEGELVHHGLEVAGLEYLLVRASVGISIFEKSLCAVFVFWHVTTPGEHAHSKLAKDPTGSFLKELIDWVDEKLDRLATRFGCFELLGYDALIVFHLLHFLIR